MRKKGECYGLKRGSRTNLDRAQNKMKLNGPKMNGAEQDGGAGGLCPSSTADGT